MAKKSLVQKERQLRDKLNILNHLMRSDNPRANLLLAEYTEGYRVWAKLRDLGVKRGIFEFFPPPADPKQFIQKEINHG